MPRLAMAGVDPADFHKGAAHEFIAALEKAAADRNFNSTVHGLVLDVGANDGTWTRSWAAQTRRLRQQNISLDLVCFEPQPTFRGRLDAIAAETGATFVPAAAWKFDGTVDFAAPRAGSTGASIQRAVGSAVGSATQAAAAASASAAAESREGSDAREASVGRATHSSRQGGSTQVRSVDLARFITTRLAGFRGAAAVEEAGEHPHPRPLSLMKLDVESAEYELLPWLLAQVQSPANLPVGLLARV